MLKVYADNGSVVARIPGAHLVPKLRHKLGEYIVTIVLTVTVNYLTVTSC